MKNETFNLSLAALAVLLAVGIFSPAKLFAHCDGLDGPVVKAARKALDSGNVTALAKLVTAAVQAGIGERFKQLLARKNYGENDVEAGREYVEAYVAFLHHVELLYEVASNSAEGHSREFDEAGVGDE